MVLGKLRLEKHKPLKSKDTRRFLVENLRNENYSEELRGRVREVRMEENGAEDLEESWNIFHGKIMRLAEQIIQCRTSYGKKKKETAW